MADEDSRLTRLAGFELLGRLGKGGMGTVLKARQVSMDRLVALKILPKRLAQNEDFVRRFIREARSAARLRHPNIVQAFDVGLAEGYYYFAMEYIEGEGLDAMLLRDGPLDPQRALRLLMQAASALAHAHEAGIVHRDIKPSNLMIDNHGDLRITDFGLAKRTEGDVAVTADGHAMGTPAYVAPEAVRGKEAEPRSDLYSLGATFFHLLAGRPPFEGKTFGEVLIKHVNEAPPPLASLVPRVDIRLCHLIDRLLRKKPGARFPSAGALLEALGGLGALQSPQAEVTRTLTTSERLARGTTLHSHRQQARAGKRWTGALVGLGVCAALVVVILVLTRNGRGPGRGQAVVAPPQPATSTPSEGPEADPEEKSAEALLSMAQKAAALGNWPTALQRLDYLEQKHGGTRLVAASRAAIAELRFQARAKLGQPTSAKEPPPPTPVSATHPPEAAAGPTPRPKPEPKAGAAVSFTAPARSEGLTPVKVGDGDFLSGEAKGTAVLYQQRGDPMQGYLYFQAVDSFARQFQADPNRTAIVTFTVFDAARDRIDVQYDSHFETTGATETPSIYKGGGSRNLEGTGRWLEVQFELPRARFGRRQNDAADFRLSHREEFHVSSVTVALEPAPPAQVPAGLERGLAAAFYTGENHERFVTAMPVSGIQFNWGGEAPAPDVPADHFSTRIAGWLYVPEAGDYTYRVRRDDGARLYLDGKLLIDKWENGIFTDSSQMLSLQAGWYRLWVEHMDTGGGAHLELECSHGDRLGPVLSASLYCERELLERIRRDPTQDPFAGLTPQDAAQAPQPAVVEPVRQDVGELLARLRPLWAKRAYDEALELARAEAKDTATLRPCEAVAQHLVHFSKALAVGAEKLKGQPWPLQGITARVDGVSDDALVLALGRGKTTRKLASMSAADLLTLARAGLDPQAADTHLALGLFLFFDEGRDTAAAYKEFAAAKAAGADAADVLALLDAAVSPAFEKAMAEADGKLRAGDLGAARKALALAQGLKPESPEPHRLLGEAFTRVMSQAVAAAKAYDFAKLADALKAADELKPKDPDADALDKWLKSAARPVLAETFESRARWEMNKDVWRIERAQLACLGHGTALLQGVQPQDFILECEMSNGPAEVGFRLGVVFRHRPPRYLHFWLSDEYNHLDAGGKSDQANGPNVEGVTVRYTKGGQQFAVDTGKVYHIRVVCNGARFEGYVDGELVVEGTDAKPAAGRVGLYSGRADARFDNVRLYRLLPLPKLSSAPDAAPAGGKP